MNNALESNHSEEPGREAGEPGERENRNSDQGAKAGGVVEYSFVAAIAWLRNRGARHLTVS